MLERTTESGVPLPAVETGQAARLEHTEIENKTTKPPARFTEGTLIQAMKSIGKTVIDAKLKAVLKETAGIGTEATRASILETLIQRTYLTRQKKHLVSTMLGRTLIEAVPDAVKDPATTAVWEQHLDAIAQGTGALDAFVQAQSNHISQLIDTLRQSAPAELPAKAGPPCPTCGKALRLRQAKKAKKGASGKFWGCSGYPDCTTTLPDDHGKPGTQAPSPKPDANHPCPECHKPMVTRKGSNGPFWGCSGYPACKHTQPIKEAPTPVRTPSSAKKPGAGQSCPDCDTGQLVQRTVRSGKNAGRPFVGCTNYPECRYFAWPKAKPHAPTRTSRAAG